MNIMNFLELIAIKPRYCNEIPALISQQSREVQEAFNDLSIDKLRNIFPHADHLAHESHIVRA